MGNLGAAILLLLLASLCGVIATNVKMPAVQLFFGLACSIMAITGGLLAWDWFIGRSIEHVADGRDALAITPASKLAETVTHMEPWQADLMRRYAVEITGIINPDDYPAYSQPSCPHS